jgi:hypothetical protein
MPLNIRRFLSDAPLQFADLGRQVLTERFLYLLI